MGCVVRFVATRASRGLGVDWRGLGVVWRARVGGWVGFEGVRLVRFVCLSRVCPGSGAFLPVSFQELRNDGGRQPKGAG